MGMGDDCGTVGCQRLHGHPGECRPSPGFTCPTRNCRRTDEHDAKGCVVAWKELPSDRRLLIVDGSSVTLPHADHAYFMPPRLKP